MRIVALQAIRRPERLSLMSLLQIGVFRVVTVDAQRRSRFRQMEPVLQCRLGARLVRHMAGLAAHVERRVPAAFFRNIHALVVASEAKIIFLLSRRGLQQLILIVRGVGIMTGQAVPYGRLMHMTLNLGRVFVLMARQAELVGNGGVQLHPGYIFRDPHFMAAQASGCDRRMNRLPFGFVFVTLQALRRINILIKWNRVSLGNGWQDRDRQHISKD